MANPTIDFERKFTQTKSEKDHLGQFGAVNDLLHTVFGKMLCCMTRSRKSQMEVQDQEVDLRGS